MRSALVSALLLTGGCYCSHEAPPAVDAGSDDGSARMGRRDPDAGFALADGSIDASCPDAGPPSTPPPECDPVRGGCPVGQACYLDVLYPDEVCGVESFVARCAPEGGAATDEPCGSTPDCGAGMACFVTGASTRCLSLCDLEGGEPRCPRGRVCAWADLPDFGACI